MKYVWLFLGWIITAVFLMLTISMLMLANWLAAIVLILLVLLCMPPSAGYVKKRIFGTKDPGRINPAVFQLMRLFLILVLLFLFGRLLIGGEAASIYASPEVKEEFFRIYDEKMEEWPLPYEDLFLDTGYGRVHVIVSGRETAPPLLLLHASGVSSWSWKFNAAALGAHFRLLAVDLIGGPGKSEYADLTKIMENGRDQADLYAEICTNLGVQKSFVAGASEGGFIGTNYALYYPERVEKLVLLGPMGYSGAAKSIFRISLAQFFPLELIQRNTFNWAFSNSPVLTEEYQEWFPLLMNEVRPMKVAPLPFSEEIRQSLQVPVLFIFGRRDNLVGDPQKAESGVQDIPDVRVEIVDAGHLMAAEIPDEINSYILSFFQEPD